MSDEIIQKTDSGYCHIYNFCARSQTIKDRRTERTRKEFGNGQFGDLVRKIHKRLIESSLLCLNLLWEVHLKPMLKYDYLAWTPSEAL